MKPSPRFDIRVIPVEETWPLRLAVLRPNRPPEAARFPGDDAANTRHFGAFRDQELVGIASVYQAAMPEKPKLKALQLRGMATAMKVRGAGFGRALVAACVAFAREAGYEFLWCNARTSAAGFYHKLGWEIVGDEFDIPDVGPHYRMWRRVD